MYKHIDETPTEVQFLPEPDDVASQLKPEDVEEIAQIFNTPLTGIASYAQLLLSDVDESDPHYEILKKLERQSFRAAQIVNNLLEFARNRRNELAPVELQTVIDELRLGKRPRIFGDGETSRDFCPVANVVQANVLAALAFDVLAHRLEPDREALAEIGRDGYLVDLVLC